MMVWRRPLIVGASGQVGTALYEALARRGQEAETLRSSRVLRDGWLRLDLAQLASWGHGPALLDEVTPDLILCAGGMTFVDGCEGDPEAGAKVNALGPAVLARYARRQGARFVFFSTDYVFNGAQGTPGPYDEAALPDPLSV